MNFKIKGLVAAVFTPFHEDGSLNLSIVEPYAERLIAQGVAGVFVNGSSGEGMLMDTEERKAHAAKWIEVCKGRIKVIIHVGSSSVSIAKDLAAHAERCGADAVASMAPNFFPSSDIQIIGAFCKEVALASPNTPFYYYHLPVATGAHIKVNKLLQLASKEVPNFVGVKFTFTDFMDMHQCIQLDHGKFDILHGHDEILINGLVLGVEGAIGTTFNFIPELYQKIILSYQNGEIEKARAYQMLSIQIVEVMLKYVNAIVGGKAILKLSGLDCGPCRLPLRNLSNEELTQLKSDLEAINYFDLLGELKQA